MKQYVNVANSILASEGPYKHDIKRMVQSSPLRFYALEQERVDLSQLKKDLEYCLGSLQDLLDGNYLTWHFPSRLMKLRNSEQRLGEFKSRYIGKASLNLKHLSTPIDDLHMQLPIEEMRMRVAKLVKELRDFWITASIKYAASIAISTSSIRQRRLRCNGVFDI